MAEDGETLIEAAMDDPVNVALLRRLPEMGLRECFLVAGCLFQAAWNKQDRRPPGWGVKDYDVFYFDDSDLSWEAEDAVIKRVDRGMADLGAAIEVRNQARVHLWYEQRFGAPYPKLTSSHDGIDRYLIECTCVGIEVASGALYAPNGLADLHAGILRINPANPLPTLFRQKARAYQARWPWLRILGD